MLHQRSRNAVCRCSDGNRARRRLLCSRLSLAIGSLIGSPLVESLDSNCVAEEPLESVPATLPLFQPLDLSDAEALRSVQWLANLALEKMPRTIDGDKDWGNKKRVWAGVKVRWDKGKLDTHRRFRHVEHGRWVRYQLQFPVVGTPKEVTATIHHVRFRQHQATGVRRWQVESTVVAPLKFEAQIQRWNLGVKLISVTIQGRMRLRMRSSAWIGFETDYSEIPPALVFDPRIEQAEVDLESFEIDRVSHVGGDVAEAWGEIVQEVIVKSYLDRLNQELVSKLNRAIDKERDDLRLSTAQWFQWNSE